MIMSAAIEVSTTENAGELHDRLLTIGSTTVIDTLQSIENESVTTTIQKEASENKTAPKLNKENCKIDFSKSGIEIYNLIRGLSPYPAAWCEFVDYKNTYLVKVYEAIFTPISHHLVIGNVISSKKELKIALKDGFLEIKALQLPGKKQMKTHELLNGMAFSDKTTAQ